MKQSAEKSPTISLRLPPPTLVSLDKAAKAARRSRSFLIKEALDRHLEDIVREETTKPRKTLSHLLSLRGVGKDLTKPRSAEEILADIRWLRGSD